VATNHTSHEHPEKEHATTEHEQSHERETPKKEHATDHEREAPKKEQHEHAEHAHATAATSTSDHEHESGKKEQREHIHVAANATSDRNGTASAKHSKPAHPPAGHTKQGEKGTAKQTSAHKQHEKAEGGKTVDSDEHDKSEKPRSERESHPHRGKEPFPWPMVVFGCVVALTVPLTVAVVLVLRARGFCGPVPSFEPVQDKDKDDGGIDLGSMSQEKPAPLEDMGSSSGHR
jgi:hypothetical protein